MNKTYRIHKQRAKLQGIIHSENLYSHGHRFVAPVILGGHLFVENLYTRQLVEFQEGEFTNGYGTTVTLETV